MLDTLDNDQCWFVPSQETCGSGCILPHSLSVRVLWARQGLLDLPQSYILGAKYLFQCSRFKVVCFFHSENRFSPSHNRLFNNLWNTLSDFQCPVSSPRTITTEVTFVDTTVYPEPPWGLPQPDWKFPFGFFTRGSAELDGHMLVNGGNSQKVTRSLMLFTVILLTGLEFLTR